MVGNLLGDAMQAVVIGAEVEGVFEHHHDADPPYSLLQWRCREAGRNSVDLNPAPSFEESRT
jgi:hypothetical protein